MKFCITGGGTGGHLMVAEALVQAAIEEGHEAIFIGSTSGQDRKYFQKHSPFSHVYFLDTTGIVNQKGFAKIRAIWRVVRAFFISRTILKEHKIEATYSVGGFSAAPASFASLSMLTPLFIHEQNAVAGKLNALLKPFCKSFISAYTKDSPLQGYPVQDPFFKMQRVRKKIGVILFLGGSQGAKAINDLAISIAKELQTRGIKIIHQAGQRDYERVKEKYEELGVEAEVYAFTKEIASLMARADLAVSRSGASTLWELCANGLPTFFVPFPYAASDHQYHNAAFIVSQNMGWCEREDENLKEKILMLLDEDLTDKSKSLMQQHAEKGVAKKMIQSAYKSVYD